MSPVDERWQAVAKAVKQRRAELGLTREQAVARSGGGVSPAVWTLIEGAKQDRYKDRTLEAVCRALGWPAGAIEWIYEGDSVEALNKIANSGGWKGADNEEPIKLDASGGDLEELRLTDPDAYQLVMDMARAALDRARARREQ